MAPPCQMATSSSINSTVCDGLDLYIHPLCTLHTPQYAGIQCLVITLGAAAINAVTKDAKTLSWVYDNFPALLTGAVLFSMLLSLYLYISSFIPGRLLAHGGNSGWAVYDFFMGRELNPRWGSFDWKEFCELYPGM